MWNRRGSRGRAVWVWLLAVASGLSGIGCGPGADAAPSGEAAVEEPGDSIPTEVFLAVARSLRGEGSDQDSLVSACINRYLHNAGGMELPAAVRSALEAEGWQIYDSDLPTGPGVALHTFSRPSGSANYAYLHVLMEANFLQGGQDEVRWSFWDSEYGVRCSDGECSVDLVSAAHGQGVAERAADIRAGRVGECSGPNPASAGDSAVGR